MNIYVSIRTCLTDGERQIEFAYNCSKAAGLI